MSKRVSVTLPDFVYEAAVAYSAQSEAFRSLSNLTAHALIGYLKRYGAIKTSAQNQDLTP